MGRARRDALSARAQRLPALRPRQVDLPELRPGRSLWRRLPHALRRHQPREGRAGVRRRYPRGGAVARLRVGRAPVLRLRLLRQDVRLRHQPNQGRQGLCGLAVGRGDARQPRHADRGGQEQPLPRAQRRGQPRPLRAHARRRIRRGHAHPARQGRHGEPQHQPARPGDLPHPPRHPPPHRRRLAHLPDVHLRPPDRGRDREHHPLGVHARVRGPAPVLRLAARRARQRRPLSAPAAAADRVRPPQPDLRGALQAQADPARQ